MGNSWQIMCALEDYNLGADPEDLSCKLLRAAQVSYNYTPSSLPFCCLLGCLHHCFHLNLNVLL